MRTRPKSMGTFRFRGRVNWDANRADAQVTLWKGRGRMSAAYWGQSHLWKSAAVPPTARDGEVPVMRAVWLSDRHDSRVVR